jgi:hypothetical protein
MQVAIARRAWNINGVRFANTSCLLVIRQLRHLPEFQAKTRA